VRARAGDVVGLLETLAGTPIGRDVTGASDGTALHIGHEELFDVLSERPGLLRQLLGRVIGHSYSSTASSTARA
jgi:hypothetical protein